MSQQGIGLNQYIMMGSLVVWSMGSLKYHEEHPGMVSIDHCAQPSKINLIVLDQFHCFVLNPLMFMRVLKVTNPGEISIREISATKEFTDFDRLNHELVSVLDTDSYIQHTLFEITIGKVCGIQKHC